MPRVRRRGHVRRDQFTDAQRETLLFGQPILDCTPEERFQTDVDARAAWFRYRAELMPEFLAQFPGERPAAWWQFEQGREKPTLWPDEFDALAELGEISAGERLRYQAARLQPAIAQT